MDKKIKFKIPGKIVINGGYLVLDGEECITITPSVYSTVTVMCNYQEHPEISITTQFKNETSFLFDQTNEANYLNSVIEAFLNLYKIQIKNKINIHFEFDDGFFIDEPDKNVYIENIIKTGLGSSACFLVGIVYSLIFVYGMECKDKGLFENSFLSVLNEMINSKFKNIHDFNELMALHVRKVNTLLNPNSSGCDVVSCCIGNIKYSKTKYEKINVKKNKIILGSYKKCTSTREMIKKINKENFNELKIINKKIISNFGEESKLKSLYKDYLVELRRISSEIVPEKQYVILLKTFEMNIFGCGVSGSGGEDCVWCIPDENDDEVEKFWRREFRYVKVVDIAEEGVKFL